MLKRFYFLCMFISILFVFSGCKEFFTFNLFDGLDFVILPKLDKENPEATVDELATLFESDSYMDALENDQPAQEETAGFLTDVYQDPAVDADIRVEAAVLAADLELAVTGGDEFLDNVWYAFEEITVLIGNSNGTEDDIAAVQAVLQGIIPEDVAGDEDAVKEIIIGILTAGAIYQDLGVIVTDPTFNNTDGIVTGGVVFNAAVCGILEMVASTFLLTGYDTPAEQAEAIWALFNAKTQDELTAVVTTYFNPDADFGSTFTDIPYLMELADAAGADLDALLGQGLPE